MEIKAVLFDLDGTLLDTEALSDKAILQFYQARGLLSPEICADVASKGHRLPWELKKQILGLRGSEWGPIVIDYAEKHWNVPPQTASVDELWVGWETNLNNLCTEVKACPGAPELVTSLASKGLPLAIATSSRLESVTKKATKHGDMFQHIPIVVAGDHSAVKRGKPAPDIYLEAARQVGVDPAQCLVFEDALSGVRAGKAAGCTVVAVPDPRFTDEERAVFSAESDYVLKSLWDFSTLNLVGL
jgi:pseudouridine-5'-monophosphatase